MRPAPFDYVAPTTVDEACALLSRHTGHGREVAVLAGGQSLVAALNSRTRRPDLVLDIGRVDALRRVELTDGLLRIGATVTQRDLEHCAAAAAVPVLAEALSHVGHPPTRNRGTLGGSIAYADPTAELPTVLLGLGGAARVRSTAGERVINADELFTGPFTTSLRADELLVGVEVPVPGPGSRVAFEQRHFRRHAKVSVLATASADGTPVAMALGGAGSTPVLVAPDGSGAADAVRPYDDPYGSVDYRRRLVGLAVNAALARAGAA